MTILWQLYSAFFRVGAFTFGGGYAMLPLLEKEVVDNNGWANKEELIDYFAIGQCTPGVIAVNTATFIGYKVYGISGAITATLGVITPSLFIITMIAALLQKFAEIEIVQYAFAGIRVAVVILIGNTIYTLIKSNVNNKISIILFIISFITVAFFNLSPIYITIGATILGLTVYSDKGGLNK